jgi:predicted dehydrogenase
LVDVGVVGYGYWGPNLVRNLVEAPECRVVAVCDWNEERLALVKRRYPHIDVHADHTELLRNGSVDAIVIATPVSSHYEIALAALRAGRHVLIEKPMTQTAEQALHLIEEADRRSLTLMVDHTFVYTGAVRKIREIVCSAPFGKAYYYDSTRVNLGLFQHDVNVIWDLAVHDLCILDYLAERQPEAVSTTGMSHVLGGVANLAYLTLFYNENFIAHVAVNWLAPVKVRQVHIGGSQQMILYNDLEPSEKVKVYHKGVTVSDSTDRENIHRLLVGYRTGDVWAPAIDGTEALRTETSHFLDCISTGRQPITDGRAGLRVLRVLEAASQSLSQNGLPVQL